MISEICAKNYCREDISLIENYEKAMKDTKQIWVCHHRDEVKVLPSGMTVLRSRQDLIDNDRYYNCPANELIFLTPEEHKCLHSCNRSASTIRKIIEANKGKTRSIFGKAFKEHYGITRSDDLKLYKKEYKFYNYYGKFSWEVK